MPLLLKNIFARAVLATGPSKLWELLWELQIYLDLSSWCVILPCANMRLKNDATSGSAGAVWSFWFCRCYWDWNRICGEEARAAEACCLVKSLFWFAHTYIWGNKLAERPDVVIDEMHIQINVPSSCLRWQVSLVPFASWVESKNSRHPHPERVRIKKATSFFFENIPLILITIGMLPFNSWLV